MTDFPSSENPLRAEVHQILREADQAWQAQDPARIQQALNGFERMLSAFPVEAEAPANTSNTSGDSASSASSDGAVDANSGTSSETSTSGSVGSASASASNASKSSDSSNVSEQSEPESVIVHDEFAGEKAAIWLWRGRFLVAAASPEMVVEGLRSLDQAIMRFSSANDLNQTREPLSIAWMNRGSGLFRLNAPDAIEEGVRSYEQVIALLAEQPNATNILGAAFMNRGVGLLRLGKEESLPEAAKSFQQAIALLEPQIDTHVSVRRNLSSTFTNLGIVHAQQNDFPAAAAAHQRSVDVFRPLADGLPGPAMFELSARLFNLGQAYSAAGQVGPALNAGRESLALAGVVATADDRATELALRARHAICVILGGLLAANQLDAETRSAHLAEASDLVDDGLAALKDRPTLPPEIVAAAVKLFEFGAWFYRTQQPQFLAEFLLEHVGTDQARIEVASAAIAAARQAVVQRNFNDPAQGGMGRVIEIMKDLGEVDQHLKGLRSTLGSTAPTTQFSDVTLPKPTITTTIT